MILHLLTEALLLNKLLFYHHFLNLIDFFPKFLILLFFDFYGANVGSRPCVRNTYLSGFLSPSGVRVGRGLVEGVRRVRVFSII